MKIIDEELAAKVVRPRPAISHKGTYGRILLIGGSKQYGGAILMAAEGAVMAGAGLTTVATDPSNVIPLRTRLPEAMAIDLYDASLLDQVAKKDVIVLGPGLGTDEQAKNIFCKVLETITEKQTLLIDASGLTLLAQEPELISKIKAGLLVLTPHQMEWQRLSGIKIADQSDQENLKALADLFSEKVKNVILVLKSHRTRVYDLAGSLYQNSAGNPGMATGGMGDTLAGITGAFLAQFGPRLDSVLAAVYCHSLAGDDLYQDNYLVLPTRLSEHLPQVMKRLSLKSESR
ncbi:NAD(P)H-hydrate dehydratase [Lactobacillus sp.]|uniref:NAD(P)H-hydrate dehydratase n=1 Tax=Lactobacillus sp. TaxID=1591 RepID=UPI003EF45A1D